MTNPIRAVRFVFASTLLSALVGAGGGAVVARGDPVLTARHLNQRSSIKVFNPTGAVRLVGWDHDSLEVRGEVSPRKRYFAAGDANGMKLGVDEASAGEAPAHGDLTIYLPRGTQVAVKTVNGDIFATDVSGWFYTIAGAVHVAGTAASIEVEAMRGDVDLNATVPWLHARGGSGHVVVRGAAKDVDVSTISGALDVAGGETMRGQFASVSGDIRFAGAPAAGAILDFSNHSGAIDLALPRASSGTFTLSTITGTITNGFAQLRSVAQEERAVHVNLGRGGADVTVRTFKGAIRLRPQ
jgi:hypothetical protein